jgi:hypothetical protein
VNWLNSVKNHARPLVANRDTAGLTVIDIVAVPHPLWSDKHETALRLYGRLRRIIETRWTAVTMIGSPKAIPPTVS